MQLFQKSYYLGRCVNDEESSIDSRASKENVSALFKMFDVNDIAYMPLDIPFMTLELDKYIPKADFQDIVSSSEFKKLVDKSIRFDFYLPEFGYVFCLNRIKGGVSYRHDNQSCSSLENLVKQLIHEAQQPIQPGDAFDMYDIMGIFRKAVMLKLRSMGIRGLFDSGFDIYDDPTMPESDFGPVATEKIAVLERELKRERLSR